MKYPFLRRLSARTVFVIESLLATLLASLLLILALHIDRSIPFPRRQQPLSARAQTMLNDLSGNVRCIVILPHNNRFYNNVRQLLLQMKASAHNASLDIEFLDPHLDIARTAHAIQRYRTNGWCLIFECNGRTEIIPFDSMIEKSRIDNDSLIPGSISHTLHFRGEQLCVTALNRLARPTAPIIYSLSGHGERDFANYDLLSGYSDFAREIRREGYNLRPLSLASNTIPADCNLLLIPGPSRPPLDLELSSILSYLSRGGRLLFLIDRQDYIPNGWEELASRIGLRFANLTAITEGTLGGYNLSIDSFPSHPIARDLSGNAVTFASPQVLDIDNAATEKYRLKTDILIAAPHKAWGEIDPDVLPRRYDPGIDRKGILPLAIASEVPAGDDLGLNLLRAVTVGDSNIGVNALMGGGNTANRDFLLNAIEWLTDSGMPSAPSIASEGNALQLNLSLKRQIRFWTNSVCIWPLSVCLLGVIVSLIRKFSV